MRTFETTSEEQTWQVGFQLGQEAKKGQVFCLIGDLGSGKTIFTQGFAKGLGIESAVCSPTFTIVCEYHEGRLPLYHFDVYRISEPEEMDQIGYEDYFYGDGVCLVEWANLIAELLPEDAVLVRIERDLTKGQAEYRRIQILEEES